MQTKILFLGSLIGALGVITCTHTLPMGVVYAGDTCQCPKKLNYELNIPIPPIPKPNIPTEYDYRVECPLKSKKRVTYRFDFDVEQPIPKIPIPEQQLNIYAKVDRVTALKKDCYAAQQVPRSCGCHRCPSSSRYVLPESSAASITRNLRHPNSLDNTKSPSKMSPATKILAILFKPSQQQQQQPQLNQDIPKKTRNRRDIPRIFLRPRKSQKRTDRIVKQYNKRLKDIEANGRTSPEHTQRQETKTSSGLRPLQQLSSFLKLPRLRNKRDIKGEYDLIEKEREQIDLTLPEIIQYMPETLNPNFKRNKCNFGQRCQQAELTETTTKTITIATTTAPIEETTTMSTAETEQVTATESLLKTTKPNSLKSEDKEEREIDNDRRSTFKKREVQHYFDVRCPVVIDVFDPSPKNSYTYESFDDFEARHRHVSTTNYENNRDYMAPQQVDSVPYLPEAPQSVENEPTLGSGPEYPTSPQGSNAELDEIIADIIHKYSDFLEISTQRDKSLVEPSKEQKEQTIYFLKTLLSDWGDWSWFDEHINRPTTVINHHYK